MEGRSCIGSGHTTVRTVLFMAALTASRHNPILKPFYRRLINAGKPKMLALFAVARPFPVILRDRTPWQYT